MIQQLKKVLQNLEKDFGEEIFSDENALRLRKALGQRKSIANDILAFANIKGIPQKIYNAKRAASDFASSENQQEQILKDCYQDLINAQMLPDSAYDVISAFTEVFAFPQINQFESQKELGEFIYKNKTYKTCRIGNTIWMAENFLVMENEFASYEKAVRSAPQGWRLPTIADYQDLICEIKGVTNKTGAALKSASKWKNGLDLFGFNAAPIKMDDENQVVYFWLKGDSGDPELPRLCLSLDNEFDEIQFMRTETNDVNCIRYVKDN